MASTPSRNLRMMPVTARGQETRSRLLMAAEKIFGDRSYFRVSIADITREAGVGQGTFYLYFPSKEAIFRELVEERGHELRAHTRLATAAASNRIEAEQAGFLAFFDFIAQHTSLYRIVRQAEFVDPAVFRGFYEAMAEGYSTALSEAMERREIAQTDPEVLAYCLMGMGDFLGMRWVVWTGEQMPPETFRVAMQVIESALAGSKGPGGGGTAEELPVADDD